MLHTTRHNDLQSHACFTVKPEHSRSLHTAVTMKPSHSSLNKSLIMFMLIWWLIFSWMHHGPQSDSRVVHFPQKRCVMSVKACGIQVPSNLALIASHPRHTHESHERQDHAKQSKRLDINGNRNAVSHACACYNETEQTKTEPPDYSRCVTSVRCAWTKMGYGSKRPLALLGWWWWWCWLWWK